MLSRHKLIAAVGVAMLALPAWAQNQTGKLEIHGFGGWAFAETDGNRYVLGDGDGNYDTAELSLNVTATPADNLTVVAQIHLERDRGEDDVELDYGFVEWFFSDAARIRFGRVKHPYGLYAEIFDVGTLRPFYLLPQGIYGKLGITGKNYNGIGLKGSRFMERWGLEYDLYAGQLQSDISIPGVFSQNPDEFFLPAVQGASEVNDTVGARLNVRTPVVGLMFGVSGYLGSQGVDPLLDQFIDQNDDRTNYGAHLEYLAGPWSIRAEFARYDIGPEVDQQAYYLEAAYRFGEHWQVAARFDSFEADTGNIFGPMPPAVLDDVSVSEDTGVALNYWLNPSFVLRLNYHRVEGNRLAFPEDPAEILAVALDGVIESETDLILFGAQFSF